MNKSILSFVDDLYEDLELWYPKLRLEEAGYITRLAGLDLKFFRANFSSSFRRSCKDCFRSACRSSARRSNAIKIAGCAVANFATRLAAG